MNENIFAILALYKSKSFSSVKPLHGSGFFQDDSFCNPTPNYRLRMAQPTESKTLESWSSGIQRTCEDDHFIQLSTSAERLPRPRRQAATARLLQQSESGSGCESVFEKRHRLVERQIEEEMDKADQVATAAAAVAIEQILSGVDVEGSWAPTVRASGTLLTLALRWSPMIARLCRSAIGL